LVETGKSFISIANLNSKFQIGEELEKVKAPTPPIASKSMELMKEVAKTKRTKTPAKPRKRQRLAKKPKIDTLEDIMRMMENNIKAMNNVLEIFKKK
jgi:hypothetical protein